LDRRATLRSYWIGVDVARCDPYIVQLQEHLDTDLLRARDGRQSPDVRRIVQLLLAAWLENESTGVCRLEPLLALLARMTIAQPVGCP
jgi:hypothetical protein